jgi:type IV secretory pathway TrbD component
MLSLQLYKVLHLASIFLFLTGASILLIGGRSKLWSAITGAASLLILIFGFGLAHVGGYGMQPWVMAKFVIWLVVTMMGHMVAKRWPKQGMLAYWITLILAVAAAALAVYKP